MSAIITNCNGSSLSLPYPDTFDFPVKLSTILSSFPSILFDNVAMKLLLSYDKLIVEPCDVIKLFILADSDVLIECLSDKKFNSVRQNISLTNVLETTASNTIDFLSSFTNLF